MYSILLLNREIQEKQLNLLLFHLMYMMKFSIKLLNIVPKLAYSLLRLCLSTI